MWSQILSRLRDLQMYILFKLTRKPHNPPPKDHRWIILKATAQIYVNIGKILYCYMQYPIIQMHLLIIQVTLRQDDF